MAIVLPDNYGWVLLAASSTFIVNGYHVMLTSKYRRQSGVKYPNAYASDELALKDPKAFTFNCAQRAHANFGEQYASALAALAIAGLRHPIAAASLGATWSLGRLLYARGYTSSKGPGGRMAGAIIADIGIAGLIGMAIYTAVVSVL